MDPKFNDWRPYEKRRGIKQHRKGDVKKEAEIEVIHRPRKVKD